MSDLMSRLANIERWECPEHGPTLTVSEQRLPLRFCVTCSEFIEPEKVEYVRADTLRGTMEAAREMRATAIGVRIRFGDGSGLAADLDRWADALDHPGGSS